MLNSIVTALLEACNIDIGNVNTVAFLDLKKAFDTVSHDILLSKYIFIVYITLMLPINVTFFGKTYTNDISLSLEN